MKTKRLIQTIITGVTLIVSAATLNAQIIIKGRITEPKGKPVPFATVYIKNTISGALTDTLGYYKIKYNKKENLTLIATTIGYDTATYNLVPDTNANYAVNFIIKANASTLNEVVITPGAMQANNDGKVAVLTTLDVYTTAGAQGDVVGAIQTLPGIQKNSDQTGLFC